MTDMTKKWLASGEPWVWLNAAAVSTSIIMVLGLLVLIAINGMGHFWPAALMEAQLHEGNGKSSTIIGEIREIETYSEEFLEEGRRTQAKRILFKVGNQI